MVEKILELKAKSKEMGHISDLIKNIADQSRLISFNASIEASSAGELGSRFGVVAKEMRGHANNTSDATSRIRQLIDDTQKAIGGLVLNAEQSSKEFKEGQILTLQTNNQLQNLVDRSQLTSEAASQISFATQQQQSSTKMVVESLNPNQRWKPSIYRNNEGNFCSSEEFIRFIQRLKRQNESAHLIEYHLRKSWLS